MSLVFRGCPGTPLPDMVEAVPRATAFLDRDGVLNVDHGYVADKAQFEWLPGVKEALGRLRSLGYRLVVLTNQSGIGRGYYSEDDFLRLTDWMLRTEPFDAVCYCPHSPEENCPARKPGTGMFESVNRVFPIDAGASFFVGDKPSDVAAAQAYGVRPILASGERLDGLLRFSGI